MTRKSLKKQIEIRERRAQNLNKLVKVLGEGHHKLRKGNLFVDYDDRDYERDHWDWVECHHYRDLEVFYGEEKVLEYCGSDLKFYSPGEWEKEYKDLLSSPQKIEAGKRNYKAHERKLERDKDLKGRAKNVGL